MAGVEKSEKTELRPSETQTPEQWNSVSILRDDTSNGKALSQSQDKADNKYVKPSEGFVDFGGFEDLYGKKESPNLGSRVSGDKAESGNKAECNDKAERGDKADRGDKTDKTEGKNKNESNDRSSQKDSTVDLQIQAAAEDQQLQVREVQKDGKTQYEFYATIDDKEQIILQTDQNQSPEAIEQQVKQAQEDKVRELEEKYNVDIAENGETTKPWGDKTEDFEVSTPTLGELAAVEQALSHSEPDISTVDGKPLRIVVGDRSWKQGGGTRRDDEVVLGYTADLSKLKEVGVHELAHVGQAKRESTEGYGSYAQELGWVKNKNGDGWLLRGEGDSYWQNTGKKDSNNTDIWMRTDAEGNPADSNGNRVDNPLNPFDSGEDSDKVQKISQEEMIGLAAVKPYDNPTDDKVSAYFGNPHEMGAALITPFRNSREDRENLYINSPNSYQVAKNLDQDQINAAYGTQADGQPKYIRNPDGLIVDNTDANRQEVEEFEAQLSK